MKNIHEKRNYFIEKIDQIGCVWISCIVSLAEISKGIAISSGLIRCSIYGEIKSISQ